MRLGLLLLSLVALAGCRQTDCRLETSENSGVLTRILSNQYLKLEVAPAVSGSIIGMEYRPGQIELMAPFQYSVEKIDLIPDRVSVSGGGAKIFFWGQSCLDTLQMTVTREEDSPGRVGVEMFNRYYQGQLCSFWRQVALERDSTAIKIMISMKNIGKEKLTLQPWDNLVPRLTPDSQDLVLLPAKGDVVRLGGVGVQKVPSDQIYVDSSDCGGIDVKIAPVRNWMARRNPASPLIMAVRTAPANLMDGGFLYSWKQFGTPTHTMEMVFNPQTLEPGQEKSLEFEYLFLAGLTDLKEICGDTGINCRPADGELRFEFASVRPLAERKLKIFLNREITIGEIDVPALEPGKAVCRGIKLPALPAGTYKISGEFSDGGKFELLETIVR